MRRAALWVARSGAGAAMVVFATRRVPRVIPGRLLTDAELVVLRHPVPTEGVHLLAVPRRRLRDAHDRGEGAMAFWDALAAWLRHQAVDQGIRAAVTNVGSRQDVPLLHVHLIDRRPRWMEDPADAGESAPLLANAVQDCTRRSGLLGRRVGGGSYGFTIPADGALWSVWSQTDDSPS